MTLATRYLQLCEALHREGLNCRFFSGDQIARGFADLGHEKFCVLNPPQIVSMYTGTVSSMHEDQKGFFFWIPTVDDLVDCIQRNGFDLIGLSFEQQRFWKAQFLRSVAGESFEFTESAETLELCLGEALMTCLRSVKCSK